MQKLDSYIAARFMRGFLGTMLLLAALFSFFEFLNQLDDVGRGAYRLKDALLFVALTLPRRLVDLMPVGTLLGGVIALGVLADRGELLAMQASGRSPARICAAVLGAAVLVIAAGIAMAETAIPRMELRAHRARAQALADEGVTLTRQGFWVRSRNRFVRVDRMVGSGAAAGIDVFEFDAEGRLKVAGHARGASVSDDGTWVLHGTLLREITEEGIATTRPDRWVLGSFLRGGQAGLLQLPPYSLSTPDLVHYAAALEASGQNADRYLLALWRKAGVPLTTLAMALLSLGFVFGPTRSVSAGRRVTAGAFVGIALHLLDQLAMHLGLLMGLRPLVTALVPVVLITAAACWRLRSMAWRI